MPKLHFQSGIIVEKLKALRGGLFRLLFAIFESNRFLEIRVQAVIYRTFFGSQFKNLFVLGTVIVMRESELRNQFDNAAGFSSHHFRGFYFSAVDIEAMRFCGNTHDGEHTGAISGGYQIGG